MEGFGAKLARIQIGGVRYNSPWTQVALVGFVCFCSVGMFSAVGGLGAGGTQDAQLSDTANAILYACFAITGFFGGAITNTLGPRLTLCLGTTGYSLYVGSLWCYQTQGTRWFLILAGAILGVTAALLWSAQGVIMTSYPLEKDKGRSFSLFWTIFSLGALVGSCIALGIEFNSTLPTVSTGVYLAFMIIQITAIASSWLILPPHLVVRGDGTVVEVQQAMGPRQEFIECFKLLKSWKILMLLPMFFASNYFYAYQGAIVAFLFNGRTRALVSLLTGLGAIVGSIVIGFILDGLPFNRRKRSLFGCAAVIIIVTVTWAGGLAFQVGFTRNTSWTVWDWTSAGAAGPIVLLMSYYIGDAMYQGLAYYTMGAITNDPFVLGRLVGLYKGVQSAGAAVSFGMDAVKTPYLTEHLVSWIMMLVTLPLCAYVLYKTPDTNYDKEPPVHVEDLTGEQLGGAALPKGHHTSGTDNYEGVDDKKDMGGVNVNSV